ncbi:MULTISPECIES: TRAP transporter large permease [unclassified Bradyrhizobium]|uniref:TRAP transporter large permease n=1 Tax=unclassified Bradyrhizobium TaxID=2631580 RepID=UPI00339210E5
MSPGIIGAIGIASLLLLLFIRIPVWAALALVGFAGNFILSGLPSALTLTGTSAFDVSSAYTLSVIPLFVLLGEVASNTRLSADLFNAARLLLSGVRGGLAIATIAASACFGAVCGSSIVTAATMTRIALPEMRKAGYDDRLATGSLAAGGSIGILIPPSIILVIYASIAEQSVPKLFAAALLPGLLLTALYMAVAVGIAFVYPDYAPRQKRASTRERLKALAGPWQFILLFIVTIGGIYAGIFSPTEAAAVGAFGSIVLGAIAHRLTWRTLWQSIEASIRTSCMLFVIIIGANLFSSFMVQTQFPTMLADGASALNLSAPVVMTMIVLAYIVMGCFLEGIGMVLITVPVFLPLVVKFGYDPIWFSILVVIVVEVGLIHPPVGMNLFVIQAQAPDVRITSIYRGIVPFLIAPLVLIVILFLFPGLALWLPKLLYG